MRVCEKEANEKYKNNVAICSIFCAKLFAQLFLEKEQVDEKDLAFVAEELLCSYLPLPRVAQKRQRKRAMEETKRFDISFGRHAKRSPRLMSAEAVVLVALFARWDNKLYLQQTGEQLVGLIPALRRLFRHPFDLLSDLRDTLLQIFIQNLNPRDHLDLRRVHLGLGISIL